MFTLYYTPNTCALATHLALAHANAEYELVHIDFSKNEQREAGYLNVNPKGRVPALVTGRGVLKETPATLMFIAQTYPDAHQAPLADTFRLAEMNAFNSYLCSTVHVAHAHLMRGYRWADEPEAWDAMRRRFRNLWVTLSPLSKASICADRGFLEKTSRWRTYTS